jgi:hypothetical protein
MGRQSPEFNPAHDVRNRKNHYHISQIQKKKRITQDKFVQKQEQYVFKSRENA